MSLGSHREIRLRSVASVEISGDKDNECRETVASGRAERRGKEPEEQEAKINFDREFLSSFLCGGERSCTTERGQNIF